MNRRVISHKSEGQGMTEYMIILALVAVSAMAIVRTTSGSMKEGFGKIAAALQGTTYEGGEAEEVTREKVGSKDMSDFTRGAIR